MVIVWNIKAQDLPVDTLDNEKLLKKSAVLEMYYSMAVPSGDNFLGNGYEAGTGIGFRLHMYPLRKVYAGLGMDFVGLDVKKPQLVGAYSNTGRSRYYAFLGHEFYLDGNFNLMADLAIGGVEFNNDPITPTTERFSESGTFYSPSVNVDYEFTDGFSAFARLSYTYVDMDFQNLSPVIEEQFESGSFIDFSIGLRYTIKTRNVK
jgi:hypothetical protein